MHAVFRISVCMCIHVRMYMHVCHIHTHMDIYIYIQSICAWLCVHVCLRGSNVCQCLVMPDYIVVVSLSRKFYSHCLVSAGEATNSTVT